MSLILIVDDHHEDLRSASTLLDCVHDFQVVQAGSAQEAIEYLNQLPVSVVVTDLNMPQMGGLELLRAIRQDHPNVPVIVMTGHGSEDVAAVALNEGASGYVPKRMLDTQLVRLVSRVLNSAAARKDMQRLERVLDFTETRFVIDNESELAVPIIGYLQEKANRLLPFDETELVQIGLAVDEALNNAIFHGNLEVASELRDADDGSYHELVQQRRCKPPFASRKVEVICRVSTEEFVCVIRDQGKGFAPEDVADPLAPENLERAGGRGLLMIRQFMDEVRHNEQANEITMIKRRPQRAE